MENLNKKLAYGLWGVSALSLLLSLYIYFTMAYMLGPLQLVSPLLVFIFQCVLGFIILRDKNDGITMITIILIALFTFNLSGLVAIVMRLILRKTKSEKIRNAWYVPAIVSGVLGLIVVVAAFHILDLVSVLISVAYYAIFGYWFLKYLKLN